MFRQVVCAYEGQNYKINYKYDRYKHIKPILAAKISCSFICSFIFLIFSYLAF